MDGVRLVGVVGCGVMGSGVAEACARAGLAVTVVTSTETSAQAGRARIDASLEAKVSRGRLTPAERADTTALLSFTTRLEDLGDRQLVIETVTEHEATKLKLFAELDKILADPGVILASSTSSIPIVRISRATSHPSRVIGMHFFNPAPVLPLVELVASLLTDDATRTRVERFVTDALGKQVIWSPDRAGFVVNALLIPYLVAAIRMYESGFASVEDIDKGMTLGCAHPMGPLRLADLIGLDTVAAAAQALYAEFKEPTYSPPPLLMRMVDAGMLGKKAGIGFFHYG